MQLQLTWVVISLSLLCSSRADVTVTKQQVEDRIRGASGPISNTGWGKGVFYGADAYQQLFGSTWIEEHSPMVETSLISSDVYLWASTLETCIIKQIECTVQNMKKGEDGKMTEIGVDVDPDVNRQVWVTLKTLREEDVISSPEGPTLYNTLSFKIQDHRSKIGAALPPEESGDISTAIDDSLRKTRGTILRWLTIFPSYLSEVMKNGAEGGMKVNDEESSANSCESAVPLFVVSDIYFLICARRISSAGVDLHARLTANRQSSSVTVRVPGVITLKSPHRPPLQTEAFNIFALKEKRLKIENDGFWFPTHFPTLKGSYPINSTETFHLVDKDEWEQSLKGLADVSPFPIKDAPHGLLLTPLKILQRAEKFLPEDYDEKIHTWTPKMILNFVIAFIDSMIQLKHLQWHHLSLGDPEAVAWDEDALTELRNNENSFREQFEDLQETETVYTFGLKNKKRFPGPDLSAFTLSASEDKDNERKGVRVISFEGEKKLSAAEIVAEEMSHSVMREIGTNQRGIKISTSPLHPLNDDVGVMIYLRTLLPFAGELGKEILRKVLTKYSHQTCAYYVHPNESYEKLIKAFTDPSSPPVSIEDLRYASQDTRCGGKILQYCSAAGMKETFMMWRNEIVTSHPEHPLAKLGVVGDEVLLVPNQTAASSASQLKSTDGKSIASSTRQHKFQKGTPNLSSPLPTFMASP